MLIEHLARFIGDSSHVFRGKINPNGNAENDVSMTSYTLKHCGEISSCTISVQFFTCLLLTKFLQMFSYAFQALISVELNFVIKSWSSSTCAIYGPKTIPSFILAQLILGNFFLK
jgi:hypothetical protein